LERESAIFGIPDSRVVGGIFEVVPAVIEERKKLQSERWALGSGKVIRVNSLGPSQPVNNQYEAYNSGQNHKW